MTTVTWKQAEFATTTGGIHHDITSEKQAIMLISPPYQGIVLIHEPRAIFLANRESKPILKQASLSEHNMTVYLNQYQLNDRKWHPFLPRWVTPYLGAMIWEVCVTLGIPHPSDKPCLSVVVVEEEERRSE